MTNVPLGRLAGGHASGGLAAAPGAGGPPQDRAHSATETFRIASSGDVRVAVSKTARLDMLAEASAVDRALIATMVSELGSNIVKYARRGLLRVSRHDHLGGIDIDVDAEDNGPGISDVALALRDHYSTGGTLGLGLPGVRRMADRFVIQSQINAGTRVSASKRISDRPAGPYPEGEPRAEGQPVPLPKGRLDAATLPEPARWEVGSMVRPCIGHLLSGDAVAVVPHPDGLLLAIVDVSGHGPAAHAVARRVIDTIVSEGGADLAALMARLHRELRGSAGAAIGLAFIDAGARMLRYMGVGNTRAAKSGAQPWLGVSRDGVVGDRAPTPFEQQVDLQTGDLVLLWTDGIPELASREFVGSVALRDASAIARGLVDRLARPYDDAACVVLKWLM